MGKTPFYQNDIRNKTGQSGYNIFMKVAAILLPLLMLSACSAQPVESQRLFVDQPPTIVDNRTPVLVELFTSEGCSSCPPAERILADLQKEQPYDGVEIITMALHVDYWDDLGWKDPFASPLFTQRQRVYDRKFRTGRIYTPQMVVDGDYEFIGSNQQKAAEAVNKAVKQKKATLQVSGSQGKLNIAISNIPKHSDATVYLAFVEDNLGSRVQRGENAGKNLTHISVVRALKGLGRIGAAESSFDIELPLQLDSSWSRERLNAVVFVQENANRRILGAIRKSIEQLVPAEK